MYPMSASVIWPPAVIVPESFFPGRSTMKSTSSTARSESTKVFRIQSRSRTRVSRSSKRPLNQNSVPVRNEGMPPLSMRFLTSRSRRAGTLHADSTNSSKDSRSLFATGPTARMSRSLKLRPSTRSKYSLAMLRPPEIAMRSSTTISLLCIRMFTFVNSVTSLTSVRIVPGARRFAFGL